MSLIALFFLLSPSLGHTAIGGVKFSPTRINFHAQTGDTKTATVTVTNQRKTPVVIEMETKDYYITPDGKISLGTPDTIKGACSPFLSISPQKFTLEPGKNTVVRISIQMPTGSAGTYWTNIYANDVSKKKFIKKPMGQDRYVKINLNYRWEIKICETVPGTEIEKGQITDMRIEPSSKEQPLEVQVSFKNTGNTILKCSGKVAIKDEDGQTIQELLLNKKGTFGLLPYGKRIVTSHASAELPKGNYTALAIIDYGGEDLVAGEMEFEVR